ncbi:hypothetical protein D3C81_1730750 [compost metagenome]
MCGVQHGSERGDARCAAGRQGQIECAAGCEAGFAPGCSISTAPFAVALQEREERRWRHGLGGITERILHLFGESIGKIAHGITEQRVKTGMVGKQVRHGGNLTVWPPADARWRTVRVGVPDTYR